MDIEEIISLIPKGTTLAQIKDIYIMITLKKNNGNKTHTCRDLGISIRSLRDRLKKYAEEESNIKKYRGD